ncbi:MAG: GspH/FimT family protein [Armatimonadota bacterium]|nr:GspH/FimT family protein [Armatimonadota bacterium]MDR7428020.1 GspH/FimT family protein [Armatimonadota bacterium]MDR7464098.1 GspH/FimT family protein [Armatimonadota bacterium]MDR7475657.1 GspH/FimT family protein [Armatimonadota bacterium]
MKVPVRPGGFSFLELLVVVGLLAILLVVALPQLFAPEELGVETTARQVAADLVLARRLAIARRMPYVVSFAPPGGPYTAYTVAPQGGAPEPDFPKSLPEGIAVTGSDLVTFQPSGAASAAARLRFAAGGATAQVDVAAGTGRVRVSAP